MECSITYNKNNIAPTVLFIFLMDFTIYHSAAPNGAEKNVNALFRLS